MIRLGISVEGATEREFVSRVLKPHLLSFGIDTTGLDIHGNVSLDKIHGVLPSILGDFNHVSTLYDFYGFKQRAMHTVETLTAAIGERLSNAQRARLTPYVQLHEFEALLFAVPEQTVEWLEGNESALQAMRQAVTQCGSPEAVNDSPHTSPSHRLKGLFGSNYDKKFHGPEIIELAGLPAIRAECPRFDAWVASLEKLGGL